MSRLPATLTGAVALGALALSGCAYDDYHHHHAPRTITRTVHHDRYIDTRHDDGYRSESHYTPRYDSHHSDDYDDHYEDGY